MTGTITKLASSKRVVNLDFDIHLHNTGWWKHGIGDLRRALGSYIYPIRARN